jgi:hypothetical protein
LEHLQAGRHGLAAGFGLGQGLFGLSQLTYLLRGNGRQGRQLALEALGFAPECHTLPGAPWSWLPGITSTGTARLSMAWHTALTALLLGVGESNRSPATK